MKGLGFEPVAEGLAVFVEAGWAVADRGAFAVDAQWWADQGDAVDGFAGLHAELFGEREGLVDLVDRAGGDLGLAQQREPVLGRGGAEHGLQRGGVSRANPARQGSAFSNA